MPLPTRDFDAEFDADTLARADEIRSDPSRKDRAMRAAQERAERAKKEAERMSQNGSESTLEQGFTKL